MTPAGQLVEELKRGGVSAAEKSPTHVRIEFDARVYDDTSRMFEVKDLLEAALSSRFPAAVYVQWRDAFSGVIWWDISIPVPAPVERFEVVEIQPETMATIKELRARWAAGHAQGCFCKPCVKLREMLIAAEVLDVAYRTDF